MLFVWLTLFVIIIFILSLTIKIKFEIDNLKIVLPKINKKATNQECKIKLKIYVLKKIKIIDIDLKKIDFNNIKTKNRLKRLEDKIQQRDFKADINIIAFLKSIDAKLEKMNLKIFLGIENAEITAICVGLLASGIAIILKNKIGNNDLQKYEVIPIYQDINIIKIEFDGIFSIDMRNIINIFKLLKKRSVKKDGRTSNRRAYAYSNE